MPDTSAFRVVGVPVPRIDAWDKVSGRHRFLSDRTWHGDLVARVVRSPHAKARLSGLTVTGADVVATYLPEDVPTCRYNPALAPDSDQLRGAADKRLLTRHARHVGDGVALVVATSQEAVDRAVGTARTDWEAREAAIHPAAGEGTIIGRVGFGDDVERVLADSAVVVAETFSVTGAQHVCLETHCCRAEPTADGVTVWSNTQSPGELQRLVAEILDRDRASVRVCKLDEGGGFGCRQDMYEEALVAWAALRLGRPVRLTYDRAEEFQATRRRHAVRADVRLGLSEDGAVTAIDIQARVDSGAYGSHAPYVTSAAALTAKTLYPRAVHRFTGEVVRTNTLPGGAYRGYGVAQLTFMVESALSMAAARLGMDPVVVRLRNASARLSRCLTVGRERFGWPRTPEEGTVRRGFGVAGAIKATVGADESDVSTASVEIGTDGIATLRTGTCDSGTGSSTVLAQVVAEELGIPFGSVRVVEGDTAATTTDVGSAAQRSVFLGAGAARDAARLARRQAGEPVTFRADRAPTSCCACFVAVSVDVDLGTVTVDECLLVTDCGRVLNPLGAAGQVHGGVAQGIGLALTDLYPAHGVTTIQDHGVPGSLDVPLIDAVFVGEPVDKAPYGGLGLGELPIVPVPAAIAAAVRDATGVLPTEIPMRPETLWRMLTEAGS